MSARVIRSVRRLAVYEGGGMHLDADGRGSGFYRTKHGCVEIDVAVGRDARHRSWYRFIHGGVTHTLAETRTAGLTPVGYCRLARRFAYDVAEGRIR